MNDLEHELRRRIRGSVRFDQGSRLLYSTDASMYQVEPIGVVIPRDAEDVAAALDVARRLRVALLPRGGEAAVDRLIEQVGSRVTSAARALGMLVSDQPDLERLRRQARRSAEMSDLSRTQLVSRVQRLVARNDALQRELAQMRLLVDTLTAATRKRT